MARDWPLVVAYAAPWLPIAVASWRKHQPWWWLCLGAVPLANWAVWLYLELIPGVRPCRACGVGITADTRFMCPHCGAARPSEATA